MRRALRTEARSRKCASRQKNFEPGRAAFFLAAQLQAASREIAYAYGESTSVAWHLNTPRLVADATGTTVWRSDQDEPFGVNVRMRIQAVSGCSIYRYDCRGVLRRDCTYKHRQGERHHAARLPVTAAQRPASTSSTCSRIEPRSQPTNGEPQGWMRRSPGNGSSSR